ncbi:MAG: hypothetical protein KA319_01170 [Ferruginibacter sp.]|nr:hypothetical protein [Ferruginibacter sp.]
MKNVIVTFIIFFIATIGFAQSVAVNSTGVVANPSSILDASATNKGVLIPRLSKAQKNAIASPAVGLLVYQNTPDSIGFNYYDGTKWLWLAASNSIDTIAWKTTGNVGTNTTTSFIGTKDNVPLSFRQNNEWIGRLDATNKNYFIGASTGINSIGSNNVVIGDSAFGNATTAYNNVALGSSALSKNKTGANNIALGVNTLGLDTSGNNNIGIGNAALFNSKNRTGLIAIGDSALYNNSVGSTFTFEGSDNLAFGNKTLFNNLKSNTNIAIGNSALYSLKDGFGGNFAIGINSLYKLDNGFDNYAFGNYALYNTTTGFNNLAFGHGVMYANTTGSNNIAIGSAALNTNITGKENIAIGVNANNANRNGDSSISIGNYAMQSNLHGKLNIAIGIQANVLGDSLIDATAIGSKALVSANNSMVLGNTAGINGATVSTNVGIGTTNPATSLDVQGGIRTKYSGSIVTSVTTGFAIVNLTIAAVPAGWDFTNTMVVVTNVDGATGSTHQAKLTSTTNIQLFFNANTTNLARFNYIIFKL